MKKYIALSLAAVLTAVVAPAAYAEDFPTRPITLVIPYSAGGSADLIARTVGEAMGRILGQPVVVESRPGAGTAIAATHVAASEPDGYTLMLAGSPTYVITPALNPDAGYDGIKDFAFVSSVASVPNVLVVSKKSGITTIDQLVEKAKEAPDTISYASVGNGSLPHLTGLMFSAEIGAQMLHIPYPGVAPAAVDLLASNVDTGFMNAPALVAHIQSGDLIALAVASTKRSSSLPDVKTMGELGFNEYEMGTWYGISAPSGTPAEVVAKLDAAVGKAMVDPEVTKLLEARGVDIFYKPTADFEAFIASDAKTVLGLIETSGVKNAK